jgi:hypothetical protein
MSTEETYIRERLIPLNQFYNLIQVRQNSLFKLNVELSVDAPAAFSLQQYCKEIYNQGQLGSCTANSACSLLQMLGVMEDPSRLFTYTITRLRASGNGVISDLGADAATIPFSTTGVCKEQFMPYNMDANQHVIGFGQFPSAAAYADALTHTFPDFVNITGKDNVGIVKTQISTFRPVPIAFLVYQSFMTQEVAKTGIMPMPNATDLAKGPVGGHEVLAVAYDAQGVLCQNSWGKTHGLNGFFYIPYAYFSGTQTGYGNYVMQLLTIPGKTVPVKPDPVPPSTELLTLLQNMNKQVASLQSQVKTAISLASQPVRAKFDNSASNSSTQESADAGSQTTELPNDEGQAEATPQKETEPQTEPQTESQTESQTTEPQTTESKSPRNAEPENVDQQKSEVESKVVRDPIVVQASAKSVEKKRFWQHR